MFAVPPNTVAEPENPAQAHPVRLARSMAADRERWRHLLRYDPDQRWFGLLECTEQYEAWLLSWLPGQHTELHDHGGATGAFTLVFGTLAERVVHTAADGAVHEVLHRVGEGQSRVFGPNYVHQVHNDTPNPAVSVHVYRPARVDMAVYELDPVHGLRRER